MSRTPEQERFLRQLASIVINVAERHPALRGPWMYDEESERELQKRAEQARIFLATTDQVSP